MSYAERQLVKSYSGLFEGLSSLSKAGLIEQLSKSLKAEKKSKDTAFYKSFGAFGSVSSPEEIINEIKENRKFRKKDLKF